MEQSKGAPLQSCKTCGTIPKSDDDLALAFMLTDGALSKEELIEAAKNLKSGQKIEIPAMMRTAAVAAIQSFREQKNKAHIGIYRALKRWAIGGFAIAMIILFFHPWTHFQWASYRNNIESYQSFAYSHPESKYSDEAWRRIEILVEDNAWNEALKLDDIESYRQYAKKWPEGRYAKNANHKIKTFADEQWLAIATTESRAKILEYLQSYPETSFISEAKAKIVLIADSRWLAISHTQSDTDIQKFLDEYPESTKKEEAETRLQELHNDWEWVRKQDKIEQYQRFTSRHPNHPQKKWIDKRIIDLEVKQIAAGEYGKLPKVQALSFGGTTAEVEIENRTGYELTVRYSGPDSKKIIIQVGATREINLRPGDYQIAASVSASKVRNYYGRDTMRGGKYPSSFYIKTTFGGSTFSLPLKKRQ